MDNYLAHRWPVQAPPAPAPEWSRREKRKARRQARRLRRRLRRERHPVRRVIFVIVLILAFVSAIGVGSWFLAKELVPIWFGEMPSVEEGAVNDHPPLPSDFVPEVEITIPRAPTNDKVKLNITEKVGIPLTPQEIYEKVLPSVVSVSVYKAGEDVYAGGSGVIMTEDGYIITNYHIVEEGAEATVMLLSDESVVYPARLVGYDEELDLAVLKIEAHGLKAATFGSSDALRVGDPAYAIGNPLGLNGTMTDGIISYLNRSQTINGYDMTLIQTSVILNSGNSGGALVNSTGQVVGIVVAKFSGSISGSALAEGMGFAIPISAVRPYIDRIIAAGESWKPTIGITCYQAQRNGEPGILVATVEPGTPAEAAGLRPDDFISHANGVPAESLYGLKRVLGEVGVGGTLTCTVWREGQQLEISFALIDGRDLNQ